MAMLFEFTGNFSLHHCTWICCCIDLTLIYGYVSRMESKVENYLGFINEYNQSEYFGFYPCFSHQNIFKQI